MRRFWVFFLTAPALAQLTTDQKVFDFQALAGLYAKHYAPYDWKRTLFGFDAFNIGPWLDRVNATANDLDFYELMVEYVSDLQDGHDAYHLPSNFVASLGFTVDIYDGNVLIDSINRTRLPQAQFPFAVGDQLISVDGAAVSDLLNAYAKYARYGNDRSTARAAAARIVTRPQQLMPHAIDVGDTAAVAIQNAAGNQTTYTIPWIKTGVPLTEIDPAPPFDGSAAQVKRRDTGDTDPEALLRELQTSDDPGYGFLNYASLTPIFALPQGFVQRLGADSATDFFYSGTYMANGLRIGYIRVPTYGPASTAAALTQFQKEIAYFQANTDGLVVDQMRNDGGLLCYGESIVSNLIPTDFHPIGYAIRVTYDYLVNFGSALAAAQAAGNQPLAAQYQVIYNALLASYSGNQRLTDPVPFCGPSFDRPPAKDSSGNVIAYSKPMIMLIDEFSVSTADSVPAVIQDNQRGPLVGWRTNGMGGNNSLSISRFQVGAYSEGDTGLTLALMVRAAPIATTDYPTSAYIENVGVRPDITVDYMTRDNLLNHGQAFVQAFTNAIVQQIQQGH